MILILELVCIEMRNRESKVANLSPIAFAKEYVFRFDIEIGEFLRMNMLHTTIYIDPYLERCMFW